MIIYIYSCRGPYPNFWGLLKNFPILPAFPVSVGGRISFGSRGNVTCRELEWDITGFSVMLVVLQTN